MHIICTIADVKTYMFRLAETGRAYHWDDSPSSIVWAAPITDVELAEMESLHAAVWSVCNPWELMDSDPAIARIYFPDSYDEREA